jgi:hypothetical protein
VLLPMLAGSWVRNFTPIFGKFVDSKRRPKIGGHVGLCFFDLNPSGICNAINGVEGCRNRRSVNQSGISHFGANFGSNSRQPRVVTAKHRIRERDEQGAVANIPIPAAVRKYRQVVILTGCFAALTEQDRMGGRSIKTLVL